ncbi:AlpA family transcriptional regulator [Aeromonas veronii]|uniref:AlpA family phage regulatory protein n=1 Tax=Aeromonas allosaccharophila TaxID=656 RepID=A0ABZ0FAC2_9GAMM|nr:MULTISPECIES: AlpA family phage regulatory protein [Aeromonas]MBL0454689.1 AlpA family phage regulatory protein [Aeromonas veronii]MCO5344895.1 AlpA family transcriptional regulator [Aeromonas veronii]MCX0439004.1 AlpA family transcriptional regulator [Aeromonas veronii]UYB71094.1 AlpA family transcriptional regulator [Aeromonas veronii]WOE66361.1 AlpA family phage regulatory protein [Aeromonas allosaccharophila]
MSVVNHDVTAERAAILAIYGASERLCRESERKQITTISRSRAWELERQGKFPMRRKLGNNSCAWLLSDLLLWLHQQPEANQNKPA